MCLDRPLALTSASDVLKEISQTTLHQRKKWWWNLSHSRTFSDNVTGVCVSDHTPPYSSVIDIILFCPRLLGLRSRQFYGIHSREEYELFQSFKPADFLLITCSRCLQPCSGMALRSPLVPVSCRIRQSCLMPQLLFIVIYFHALSVPRSHLDRSIALNISSSIICLRNRPCPLGLRRIFLPQTQVRRLVRLQLK
jgi:hypothetical protein